MNSLALSDTKPSLPAWLRTTAAVILALLLAKAAIFHWKLIHFPYPLDSHEPAQALLAQEIAAGRNPGDLSSLPIYTNHYGPGYSELTGHLCRLGIACDLKSQRILSALLMASLLLVLGLVCRRLGAPWLETASILVWIYALLLVNVTPISRPDSLANLLWFSGLALPFLLGMTSLSLVLASVLFCGAFVTKLYYVIGPGMLGLWLLYHNRRKFLFFLCAHALLFSATLVWLFHRCPYTLYEGLLLQTNNMAGYSLDYMLWQLKGIFLIASPGLLALIALALWCYVKGARRAGGEAWFFYAELGLLIFIGYMGGNRGARLTYVVQLIMLPLAACLAVLCQVTARSRILALCFLLLSAGMATFVADHGGYESDGKVIRQWQAAEVMVRNASKPVAAGDLAMMLKSKGVKIYDTGLSKVFWHGVEAKGWKALVFTRTADLVERCDVWKREAREDIQSPRTDYAFLTRDSPFYFEDVMKAHFDYLGVIHLPYPQTTGVTVMGVFRNKNIKAEVKSQRRPIP